jgi:hypothetical protein
VACQAISIKGILIGETGTNTISSANKLPPYISLQKKLRKKVENEVLCRMIALWVFKTAYFIF